VDIDRDFGYVDETGKRFLELGEFYILIKDKKIKIELVD
jgi:beta-glucosidase